MEPNYQEIASRVLSRLQGTHGSGDIHDHMTLDTWEWPQGVAVYAMYKLYKATGDHQVLDAIIAWYDRNIAKGLPPRNVNTTAPMLTMAFLYQETGNPVYLPIIRDWANWVMNDMPRTK